MERLLKSKFKIREKIGENPFSLTYLGTTLSGEQQVVVKIYKRGTLNSTLIKSMKQKVKTLQEIEHPGIARLLDGDYGWQGFYYVREHVKGKSLRDYIKNQKLNPDDALNIISNTASVLAFAHKNGIIHGALKPSNIFMNEQGHIMLTDFIIEGEIKESMPQKALFILEESEYASPEEIYGSPAQPSSDIYALGIILYELLSGAVPFRGNPQEKITGLLPSIPSAPKYVEDILAKALHLDPLLRFNSMEELQESIKCRTLIEIKEKWDLPAVELENAPRAEEKAVIPINKERKRSFFLAVVVLFSVLAGIIYSIINSFILSK